MTKERFEVEFANRNGTPTKTEINAGSEYEARKAVSLRDDFDSIIACRQLTANSKRGLILRKQAMALLQKAATLDGRQPYSVTHRHDHGSSTYLMWASQPPSEAEAAAVLEVEYEPEKDESLDIEQHFTLEEICGVADSSGPEVTLLCMLEEEDAYAKAWDALVMKHRTKNLKPEINREQAEASMRIGFDAAWNLKVGLAAVETL